MVKAIKQSEKKQIVVVLILTFILGLVVSGQYGSYIDQSMEMNICGMNIKEYMLRILGDEKPHHKMEYMFITTYGNIGRIAESVEWDHGVAPYYPIGIMILLVGRTTLVKFIWHYYTFILFYMGCLALYGIMYELFHKRKLALVTFGFLFLSPRIFAEGHYNNKDIVLMAFGLLTIYFGIRYILHQKLRYGLLFATMAAIMTNIKIIGMWFWAVIGLAYLIYHIYRRTLTRQKVGEGIGVILFYLSFFMLITPASWDDLLQFVQYSVFNASSFARWDGSVRYAGQYIHVPLPWHYLPVEILISTPLILILLSLLGHVRGIVAIVRREENALLYGTCMILYMVPFVYAICNRNLIVYNGWRHFYFIYGPLMIFAGVGCETVARILERTSIRKKEMLYGGFCGGILCFLLFLIVWGHPYQYSYVNCLAARPAEDDWELDYWCVTGYQTLKQLYNYPERNMEYELTIMGVNGDKQIVADLDILPKSWQEEMRYASEEDGMANYIVSNCTYSRMNKDGYHYLFGVSAYGNQLYEVYERD